MKVVLTGGGTGGHAYPAIAIAEALRELDPSAELLFIGSASGPEKRIASESGIEFRSVPSAPFPKSITFSEVVGLAKNMTGIFAALAILKAFRPHVAVGTGGYTTVPVLIAQRLLGRAIILHEQNAIPGRANRWLARFAECVCVTFPETASSFPKSRVAVTGLPIRKRFSELPAKTQARLALSLGENRFTILVLGGSLGARRINELMFAAWDSLYDGNTQVIHQVGPKNMDQAEQLKALGSSKYEGFYRVEPFVDMPLAMAAADLLVGRSGASTLAEATASGLPCILIPYPHSVADEQTANARYLVDRRAAIMFKESDLTPRKLAEAIIELRSDPDRLRKMSEASRSLAKPGAASDIARIIAELAHAADKV